MAMLQTWALTLVLFFQSFLLPLLHPPMQGPVSYGGDPYVDPKAGVVEWLPLFENGATDYTIVLPDDTGDIFYPSLQTGARWLKEFAAEITGGATFAGPVTASAFAGGKCIALGSTGLDAGALAADITQLKDEGFVKKVIGENVFICGIGRGTMYGCSSFIEEELDCRWFTPELRVTPKAQSIAVNAKLHDIENVAMESRDVYWQAIKNPEFGAFHRENSAKDQIYGYGVRYYPPGCHTIGSLAAPQDCIPEEDYAFRADVGRTPAQRCLTSPHVLELVIESAKKMLRENDGPDYKVLSISAEDNAEVCECERCLASDKKYGGPSGTNIWFVNQAAEAIEEWLAVEYPGREIGIDTFAYFYTEAPPKDAEVHIAPRRNVIVRLCSINCCFSHPLEECGESRRGSLLEDNVFNRFEERPSQFGEHVVGWGKLCAETGAKLYIWDYTTDFNFYPATYPNLHTFTANFQFYIENGVRGTFQQGYLEPGGSASNGEFAELRAYLLAKLLWNPKEDAGHIIDEFLAAYYGAAAPMIREYLDICTRKGIDNYHQSAFGRPEQWLYFKPSEVKKVDALWDKAEKAANGSAYQLANVKRSRISFRCYKANMMQGEFALTNPRRLQNSKQLFHDIVMSGINALGGMPIVEPYDLYIWLHRPFDWAGMGAWIDFIDDEKVVPLDLAAYRAHDKAGCEFCAAS